MKKIIFTLLILVSICSFAQEKKSKNTKTTTEINGNCEHCKQRIEKTALSVAGVKSAVWDAESKQLTLILNEQKTSVAAVKKAIAKVGHDSDIEKTTTTVYNDLPRCCQYERK